MPDLASLYIRVDSQGVVTASRDLNKLTDDSKKTETATEGVTSGFNKLKAVVGALAASYAALKLAQYIKDATLLAARYETLGVVMRVVGNNAGYTGAQMEQFSQGLQRAGISMLASRTVLTRMVQAQLDLAQSSKLARIAQDAAVIGNINSSEAFERMIYGIQSAQTEMLRTIGINVNFENSYQAVAEATERASTSFTEAEKAQIRLNTVMDAGKGISGAYAASMETAGKQVLSLERHIENLKVMLGAAFTPALAEIISTITGNIKSLNGELSGPGAEAIKDWGANFRLIIMSIEAEIMRLAMFIDKVGGTLTSIGMLLTGPGALIGKIPGLDFAAIPFEKFADINIGLEAKYNETDKALEALAIRYNKLVEAMTPAGKLAAKQAEDALEAIRLKATADAKTNKVAEAATKEQLAIQADFTKAYKKSIMTIEEFELDSLKTQVDAFRKAKVDETQLEEWMQNEIKNIKLRALNEALALYEELAGSDAYYAQKAIDTMSVILDAEEKKWATILQSDDDAHTLRIKRELEYRDKVLGVIDDIVEANVSASQQIAGAGTAPGAPSSTGGDVSAGTTGVEFQMTWKSYVGPLTDAVVRELNRVQKIIDDAPKIAQAAAEAAVALQKAADAAEAAAEAARRAAEVEAQRIQDIADTRVELEIQILEATGYATEALGIRRMQELAAMDESLRPLQQRLYYLEDEARAADEAAAATEKLIAAQDASLRTFENSIAALVSQGRAIKDFINSLGATGVSMTLSAARGAYMADLAGARAGSPESYGRITQSAGAYISTAGQTAGSAVEMARIVAGIKRELSALQPVVDLESNIELLKAIRQATSDTATATQRLDMLGIKAIFDLTQVLTLVDNSAGLPDHLKEMIVNQSGDYMLWIQAQLDSSVSKDLKRVLIDGAGIYATVVKATLGTVDPESQKLAITATGSYLTTVNAAMGIADAATRKLALTTTNAFLTTVKAILGIVDPVARDLGIKTTNTLAATITAVLGTTNAEAKKLGLNAINTLSSTVTAALGFTDPDAVSLAIKTANDLAATVTAALGSSDPNALTLATKSINIFETTVTAALATDTTTQQLKNMLTGAGLTTTVDGTMTWNPNDPLKAIWEAIKASTELTASNTGRYAVLSEHDTSHSEYKWSLYSGLGQLISSNIFHNWGITTADFAMIMDLFRPVFANGAAFSNGNVIPFAEGDIINSPHLFPMANGMGLMGEAGPEAIMPLTRIGGKLGVKSSGGDNVILIEEVRALRAEVKAGNFAIARSAAKTAKVLTEFDYNGMPAVRTV